MGTEAGFLDEEAASREMCRRPLFDGLSSIWDRDPVKHRVDGTEKAGLTTRVLRRGQHPGANNSPTI